MKTNRDINIASAGYKIFLYDITTKVYLGSSFESLTSSLPKYVSWTTTVPPILIDEGELIYSLSEDKWIPNYSREYPFKFKYFRMEFDKNDWDVYEEGEYYYFSIVDIIHCGGEFPDVRVHKKITDGVYKMCVLGQDFDVEMRENNRVLIICRKTPFAGKLAIKY